MSDGLDQPRLGVNEEPEEERREDVWEDPEREDDAAARAGGRASRGRARARSEEDVPAEEDELPRLRGPEHAGGDLEIPDGYGVIEGEPTGNRRAVGIVVARFNGELTGELLRRALDELERLGVGREAVTVIPVPGAFELPLAAMALAKTRRYSCIVALGAVIRGETPHFDYVASEAAAACSSPASRPACRSRSACSPSRTRSRPGPGSTRPPRPCAQRSRWPTSSRSCGPPRVRRSSSYTPPPMSKVCAICGKKPGFGNNRSHSMVATKRRFNPNLQRVRVLLDGKATRAYVCTRCLKGNKVQKAV